MNAMNGRGALGQKEPAAADPAQPELVWHEASALFPMRGGRPEDGSHRTVRLVLGRSDRFVPFSEAERLRDLLKEAGYDVTLDAFPGGHEVPEDALARAVVWLEERADRR